jgi:hypothetical protein
MTDVALLAGTAVVLVAITGVLAYKAGKNDADAPPVLVPLDYDPDSHYGDHVIVARVKYDQTGNRETLAVLDDGRSDHEAKQAIQNQVRGVEVDELIDTPLNECGPGADD